MHFKNFCISFLLIALANLSFAMSNDIDDMLLANGYAKYSELDNEQYFVGLFLEQRVENYESIISQDHKKLEIKILADKISKRKFSRMLVKHSAINNPSTALINTAKSMETLLASFNGELKRGDNLSFTTNGKSFTTFLNGEVLTAFENDSFFNVLLNIWIGNVPPNRSFKSKLLGLENTLKEESEFLSLLPESNRMSLVTQWQDKAKETIEKVASEKQSQKAAAPIKAIVAAPQVRPKVTAPKTTLVVAPKPKQPINSTKKPAQEEAPSSQTIKREVAVSPPAESEDEFSAEKLLEVQLFTNALLAHSQKNIMYPQGALKRNQEGVVIVSITIGRDGDLLAYNIVEESRYRLLNKAVLRGVVNASPYPKTPDAIDSDEYTFRVPINFKVTPS